MENYMKAKSEREKTRKAGRLVIEGNAFMNWIWNVWKNRKSAGCFRNKKRGGRGVNPLPRWSVMEISSRSRCFRTEEGE